MTTDVPVTEERLLTIANRVARRRRIKGMGREDVEQEAVVLLLQTRKDSPEMTEAQLETFALNELKKLFRKANNCPEEQDDEDYTTLLSAPKLEPEPLDVMISDEALVLLQDKLTPTEYEVVKMIYWEGCTDEDGAKFLSQTVKRFRVTKTRILKKIRESL